jgi:hypothetical protein
VELESSGPPQVCFVLELPAARSVIAPAESSEEAGLEPEARSTTGGGQQSVER